MSLIVLRHAADMPQSHRAEQWEGLWIEHDPSHITLPTDNTIRITHAVAEPTGRYEVRDDGARAEVWEIRTATPPDTLT